MPERSQTYQFDKIFGQNCDQAFVYDNAVKPYVELIKGGFSCTVFTYGQTGTGKTYTMGSALQVTFVALVSITFYCVFNAGLPESRHYSQSFRSAI